MGKGTVFLFLFLFLDLNEFLYMMSSCYDLGLHFSFVTFLRFFRYNGLDVMLVLCMLHPSSSSLIFSYAWMFWGSFRNALTLVVYTLAYIDSLSSILFLCWRGWSCVDFSFHAAYTSFLPLRRIEYIYIYILCEPFCFILFWLQFLWNLFHSRNFNVVHLNINYSA